MITTAETPSLEDIRVIAYDILEKSLPAGSVIVRAYQNESKPDDSNRSVVFYSVVNKRSVGKDGRFKTDSAGVSWYSGHRECRLVVDVEGVEAHSQAGELENQLMSDGATEFMLGSGMTIEKARDTAYLYNTVVNNSERGNLEFIIRYGVIYSMVTEFIEDADIDSTFE